MRNTFLTGNDPQRMVTFQDKASQERVFIGRCKSMLEASVITSNHTDFSRRDLWGKEFYNFLQELCWDKYFSLTLTVAFCPTYPSIQPQSLSQASEDGLESSLESFSSSLADLVI